MYTVKDFNSLFISDPECYAYKGKQDMISSPLQTTIPSNLSSTRHNKSFISDIMEEVTNQNQHERRDSDNGVTLVKWKCY